MALSPVSMGHAGAVEQPSRAPSRPYGGSRMSSRPQAYDPANRLPEAITAAEMRRHWLYGGVKPDLLRHHSL